MNWNMSWDAITDSALIPDHLHFIGRNQLSTRVPHGATMTRQALDQYQQQSRPCVPAEDTGHTERHGILGANCGNADRPML